MNKIIFSAIIGVFFSSSGYSQEIGWNTKGKIYYNFLYQFDTTDMGKIFKDKLVLSYADKGSLFQSQLYLDSRTAFAEWMKSGRNGVQPRIQGLQDEYYTNSISKEISRLRVFQSTYVMSEIMEVINWKIESDTKDIGGFICQKAVCFFRGRNYIAWFCNDIPYPFGPWKLNGLPGLIFEVMDDKKEIYFQFNTIVNQPSSQQISLPIKNSIKTTEVEFERMRQIMLDQNIPSYPGITPGSITVEVKNSQGETVRPKRTIINNPIDLKTKLPILF